MKEKTHGLKHDLTFSAHTIDCVCHSIRSMFRVLGILNFVENQEKPGENKYVESILVILQAYSRKKILPCTSV